MRVRSTQQAHRAMVVGIAACLAFVVVFVALSIFSQEWWRDASHGRKADGLHWRLSVSLAVTSLALFAASLSIGPIQVLRGRTTPVHLPWRRTIGVGAAIVGWGHVTFGITIHSTGWGIWRQFGHITDDHRLRFMLGVAVWLGALVALVFLALGLASNNWTMRRLGAKRWKWLQRFAYLAFVLLAGHVLAVQYQERRDVLHIVLVGLLFAIVAGLQVAGAFTHRHRLASRAGG